MVYVGSVGIGMPETLLTQDDAKQLVGEIFHEHRNKIRKLLPVFDNANIMSRQLVTNIEWYKTKKSFQERNKLYIEQSIKLSIEAIDNCLNNKRLKGIIPYESIDLIVFVSSTGISTPSIDSYLINERPFREDIVRMPLWGLGCGGGAIGLNRAIDWLKLNNDCNALVVCSELCSLTFQQHDYSTSNLVGTALFGDGVAATLLVGSESPYKENLPKQKLAIYEGSSYLKKGTLNIMGWEVTNDGFEVIFSKKIPRLVKTIWSEHLNLFLQKLNININDLHSFVAHPGGRKVLEEMEKTTGNSELLNHSYDILKQHGNMSSATVMYVLKQYIESYIDQIDINPKKWAILSALGPGFCSELIAMRWSDI